MLSPGQVKSSHQIIAAIYDAHSVPGWDARDRSVFPRILHRRGRSVWVRREPWAGVNVTTSKCPRPGSS